MDFKVGDRVIVNLDNEPLCSQMSKDYWRNQIGTVKSVPDNFHVRVVMDDKKRFIASVVSLRFRWCTKLDTQMALVFP